MHRRDLLKLASASALSAATPLIAHAAAARPAGSAHPDAEQYGVFEATLTGPSEGNPFVDVTLSAEFRIGNRSVTVDGFYDGGSSYKIRFMPDTQGEWSYTTHSSAKTLADQTGSFRCVAPGPGNHGPVSTAHIHHFAYADGTPYFPFGTTCYAWAHQGDVLEEQTLATLKSGPFNKIRFCVFPKSYEYNHNEPEFYPFPRTAAGVNDLTRFNPAFFAHFEKRIQQLGDLGIQADLILFHPYDRWGYAAMPHQADERYLRYLIARFAAFRNVWWSLANEFDLMKAKSTQDFDRLLHLTQQWDPYQRLRSIHYSKVMYNYASPAVTHASLQTYDFASAPGWLRAWNKPIVYDEIQYEGNIPSRWGNLSGEEITRRFWTGVVAGCYVTHGETFLTAEQAADHDHTQIVWCSHGGKLQGTSPARIGFLRKLLEETVKVGLEAPAEQYYPYAVSLDPADPKSPPPALLYYMDFHQAVTYDFPLGTGTYTADLVDPWAMTVTPVPGTHTGKATITLTGKPYQAIRLRRVG